MPTGFDDFSERAHRSFNDLPEIQARNRKRLADAMQGKGFVGTPSEWWHFDWADWKNYPVSDDPIPQGQPNSH